MTRASQRQHFSVSSVSRGGVSRTINNQTYTESLPRGGRAAWWKRLREAEVGDEDVGIFFRQMGDRYISFLSFKKRQIHEGEKKQQKVWKRIYSYL